MSRDNSTAVGFVVGALVGAGFALLLAPKSEDETRRRLADAARSWEGAARNKLDEACSKLEQEREIAHDIRQDARMRG